MYVLGTGEKWHKLIQVFWIVKQRPSCWLAKLASWTKDAPRQNVQGHQRKLSQHNGEWVKFFCTLSKLPSALLLLLNQTHPCSNQTKYLKTLKTKTPCLEMQRWVLGCGLRWVPSWDAAVKLTPQCLRGIPMAPTALWASRNPSGFQKQSPDTLLPPLGRDGVPRALRKTRGKAGARPEWEALAPVEPAPVAP